MIRVLVYHRDAERLELLCRIVRAYFQKVRQTYQLSGYRNPEAVRDALTGAGKTVDLLLLDCTRPEETAGAIRQLRSVNERASWVYLDGEVEGLLNLLILRPSAYLKNAADPNAVAAVLQHLVQYHQALQKKYDFTFKCAGEYIRIPYDEISYLESSAKTVTLHLVRHARTYDFSARLDEIQAQLPDRFLRCHQSYLVNLQHVRRLDARNHVFLLGGNEEILISRRSYTHAKERYQQYIQER